jgi:dipeptidyl aminopeptidase/acylaminoacyl peptidase
MNAKTCVLGALLSLMCVAPGRAQSNPRYIQFRGVPSSVKGALYLPDSPQPPPNVGIVVMHRTGNFMNTLACTELSQRGFAVLCMNPRSDNNEAAVRFETIPLDVAAGVRFLKQQPGITSVVLWGHSGGGATMTLYQSVAENGPSACQGPGKLVQAARATGLPPRRSIPADAHRGNR